MNITNDYRRELKSKIIEYAMNEFRQRGIKAVKMDEMSRGRQGGTAVGWYKSSG